MGIVRRNPSSVPPSPISEFWRWWTTEGSARFTSAAATGEWDGLPEAITTKLTAIHPDLAWDIGPGRAAHSLLTVTGEGKAALRRLAQQWLRAAPKPDEAWEYAAARQPNPGVLANAIEIGSCRLELGQVRFQIAEDFERQRIDVVVQHPEFTYLLPRQEQITVAFLLLDWLLGEDAVERWVGGIEVSGESKTPSLSGSELAATVEAMATRQREVTWVLMEGHTPEGRRVIASALRPLRWIDYPLFDLHTEVQLEYHDSSSDGLPTETALRTLREAEDEVTSALCTRGLLVAHESTGGTRILHYYSDSEDQNGRDAIETAAQRIDASVRHTSDPGWHDVRHLG